MARSPRRRTNAERPAGLLPDPLAALEHPLVAAVHGFGLYLGVEFRRDGEPAAADFFADMLARVLTEGW